MIGSTIYLSYDVVGAVLKETQQNKLLRSFES